MAILGAHKLQGELQAALEMLQPDRSFTGQVNSTMTILCLGLSPISVAISLRQMLTSPWKDVSSRAAEFLCIFARCGNQMDHRKASDALVVELKPLVAEFSGAHSFGEETRRFYGLQ
jgi:hypothetical protein